MTASLVQVRRSSGSARGGVGPVSGATRRQYAAQPRLTFGDIAAGYAFLQCAAAPREDAMPLFHAGLFHPCLAGAQ